MPSLLFIVSALIAFLCFLPAVAAQTSIYQLKVVIDPASVAEIHAAGQAVVIATQGAGNGWYTLWTVFSPFPNNYLTWNTSSYCVYASESPLQNGGQLQVGSWETADGGLYYPFQEGSFAGGHSIYWVSQDQVGVLNNDTDLFTYGLTMDINVNGQWQTRLPVSAEDLLGNEHAVFPMYTSLYIFLGQNSTQVSVLSKDLDDVANSAITPIAIQQYAPKLPRSLY